MTAAESDRMEKEAVYRQTQSNDPDAIAAAIIADSSGNASAATSGLLDKLREQPGQPQIQVADLSNQFGPQYPKVAQLNSQLKEIDHPTAIGNQQGRRPSQGST